MKNLVNFLKVSGKGFFVDKDGFAIALNESLSSIVKKQAFINEMEDIIKYRTMDYYCRRYVDKE